jgi:hypothetical protein
MTCRGRHVVSPPCFPTETFRRSVMRRWPGVAAFAAPGRVAEAAGDAASLAHVDRFDRHAVAIDESGDERDERLVALTLRSKARIDVEFAGEPVDPRKDLACRKDLVLCPFAIDFEQPALPRHELVEDCVERRRMDLRGCVSGRPIIVAAGAPRCCWAAAPSAAFAGRR